MTTTPREKIQIIRRHQLSITFSGHGVLADAYLVSEKHLKKWGLLKPNQGESYETQYDLHEELQDKSIESFFICHGLTEFPKINLTLNNEKIQVENIFNESDLEYKGRLEKSDYLVTTDIESHLSNTKVPSKKHLIINTAKYKFGELSAHLDISDSEINLNDIKIATHTLDLDDDISAATYQNGLLNDSEFEICKFHYKNTYSEFTLKSDISDSSFYLIKKNSKGRWHDCHLISTVDE
jgi:hypothetical protein